MRVNRNSTGWTAAPVLPGVTRLRLNGFTGTEDLSRVPEPFPDLRTLSPLPASEGVGIPEHVLGLLPVPSAVERTRTAL